MQRRFAIFLVGCLCLGGCQNMAGSGAPGEFGANKSTGGGILGAVGGGLAGAQFGHGSGNVAMAALGTLLGAFIGHEVGTSLDRADQVAATRAESKAYQAPIGHSVTWNNPDSGHAGTITPVREGTDSSGRYCREFQQQVVIDGRTQSAHGTACREPDGSWRVISQ
jgi:surface antigen